MLPLSFVLPHTIPHQGNSATLNYNANNPVNPLYMLTKSEYWFHHVDNVLPFSLATNVPLTPVCHPPSATNFPPILTLSLSCASSLMVTSLSDLTRTRPAGGCFTVEHATNRAFTTLGNPNSKPSDWPNGQDYSNGPPPDPSGCITDPNRAYRRLIISLSKTYPIDQYTQRVPPRLRERHLQSRTPSVCRLIMFLRLTF